jgi:hypothetical protein
MADDRPPLLLERLPEPGYPANGYLTAIGQVAPYFGRGEDRSGVVLNGKWLSKAEALTVAAALAACAEQVSERDGG